MLSVQQLVVGIFRNRAQTEQALNELRQLGFDNRHIRVAKHGISIDGIIEKIQSLLEEQDIQDIAANRIYTDLVDMGMSAEDARYYQREFAAGRFIVAVLRSGAPLVATSILARNGGYIVNDHYVELTNLEVGTNIREPTTEDLNAELDSTNEDLAPPADYDQEPTSEDTNAELNDANEYSAPSADSGQGNDIQKADKDVVNV